MKNCTRANENVINDLQVLEEHFGKPIDDRLLAQQMERDLEPYVRNKEMLLNAIQYKTHFWEYATFLKFKERSHLWDAFKVFTSSHFTAQRTRPKEFSDTYLHYFDSLHKGIADYADLCHLERAKSSSPDPLSAKVAFQELGLAIEGSLQPYARLFLRLLELSEKPKCRTLAEMDSLSLGQVIAELQANPLLTAIYRPAPWGISISQWRNIAQHSSYSFDESSETLLCKYGKSNQQKEITLSCLELLNLLCNINELYCLHKTTYCIVALGIPEVITKKTLSRKVSSDTVAASITELLTVRSINVAVFDWKSSPWKLVAIDQKNRKQVQLESIMHEVARLISMASNVELRFTVKSQLTGRTCSGVIGKSTND